MAPPGMQHLYFTSCRDELADKSLRVLKHRRKEAAIALRLAGGYAGHNTAAARSLTDWSTFAGEGQDFFGWPQVPHPAHGVEACIEALDALVSKHGADALLGLYVEGVQERTGQVLDSAAWAALTAWRDATGVPLLLMETATGLHRSGQGRWWLDGQSGTPDAVLWWAGGQIGHLYCSDSVWVSKPLSFISTWDGDELSGTRLAWQLRALEDADATARAKQLHSGLQGAVDGSDAWQLTGQGAYWLLRGPGLDELQSTAAEAGFCLEYLPLASEPALVLAPALSAEAETLDRLIALVAGAVAAGGAES